MQFWQIVVIQYYERVLTTLVHKLFIVKMNK